MFLSCGDRNWRDDILEAILKILCIWANICLSPKAGYQLGKKDSVITHLLDIVGAYVEHDKGTDADLILHSILVVVGNISYYIASDSELCIEVSKCVTPLLDDSYSFEIRLESANIIRNLTRSPKTRAYIQEHSLLPAFIQLLREDGKDFNTAAYGIIMNLLIDRTSCELFYKEEGVTRLLHKLHLCADRDWKTCAFLCQILWNYCGGENADTIPIKKIEAQHLLKYLTYSLRENSGSTNRNTDQVWSNEFCPVAQKLLELLKTKKCCIS
ncbi:uncharacterized protein LOC118186395 [Stegodyphus dumicola]|uniref:uncharacterized protein LOC118186395 n=1 Tax=Stegodyphus dumicola TaxID=202533 RepID=UPI0015AB7120|nr:uncharacterized protein LOC118186395 [Stegodyphus dumicola]